MVGRKAGICSQERPGTCWCVCPVNCDLLTPWLWSADDSPCVLWAPTSLFLKKAEPSATPFSVTSPGGGKLAWRELCLLLFEGISGTTVSHALEGNSLARWLGSADSSCWEDVVAGCHLAPAHPILLP